MPKKITVRNRYEIIPALYFTTLQNYIHIYSVKTAYHEPVYSELPVKTNIFLLYEKPFINKTNVFFTGYNNSDCTKPIFTDLEYLSKLSVPVNLYNACGSHLK